MNFTVEDRPICPCCGKSVVRLWRCEAQGSEYKGAKLCFFCCEQEMVKASSRVSAQIQAMPKDLLKALAKRDAEELYGK